MDRSPRQKINKKTKALNDTLDQMNLIGIYRAFHLKAAEYTFFSPGTLSRIDHMLDQNTCLSKFKKIEIISSISYDNHSRRLEINNKKKDVKSTNTPNVK